MSVSEVIRAGVARGKERLAGPSSVADDAPPYGALPWRVGTKVGRTVYDAGDRLIGIMDTRELAAKVVDAVNADDPLGDPPETLRE